MQPESLPHPNNVVARVYQTDEDRNQLMEKHLPLVKVIVDRMRIFLPATLDIEDLYHEGVKGLMSAVRKYDPAQVAAFPAFAALHIRGAVRDQLRRMDSMPRSVREKARRLREVLDRLEQRLGRPATEAEVAEEMKISVGEYWDLLDTIRPVSFVPLDEVSSGEEGLESRIHEKIADESQPNARQELERRELLDLVAEQIQKMPDLPKKVLAMYYFENMRLSEIAAVFQLTEGRISQIHTQAVLSLRNFVRRINNSTL